MQLIKRNNYGRNGFCSNRHHRFYSIIGLRSKFGHIESSPVTSGIIMIVFLFVGEELLHLIGIDVHSFAVAGSFVLFFFALEMILGIRIYRDEASSASINCCFSFNRRSRNYDYLSLKSQFDN
jgi:hypothetical protein